MLVNVLVKKKKKSHSLMCLGLISKSLASRLPPLGSVKRQATGMAKLTWPFQGPLVIARRLQDTLFGKGCKFSNAVALKL